MIDQFYTPSEIATDLVYEMGIKTPNLVVDPTCGSGNLLLAASNRFEYVRCVGIDKDPGIIRKLKKEQPNWILSVADFQNRNSYQKSSAVSFAKQCDLLLLNPPFSQKSNKYVYTNFQGVPIKSSIAMGFVLRSLEVFNPSLGALMIAPESMLYSESDEYARHVLEKSFALEHLADLHSTTFKGTRARAVALHLRACSSGFIPKYEFNTVVERTPLSIVRGGLQMHRVSKINKNSGLRVIHSVDLKKLYRGDLSESGRTLHTVKGVVTGQCILIPRVGVPDIASLEITDFRDRVQLSDCVLSISSSCPNSLRKILQLIKKNEGEFRNLYKGTGARYTTISRLLQWFSLKGMVCKKL